MTLALCSGIIGKSFSDLAFKHWCRIYKYTRTEFDHYHLNDAQTVAGTVLNEKL